MGSVLQFVVFRIEVERYALSLQRVLRVTPAVEVTPTPGTPAMMLGVIDLGGELVPVLDRAKHPSPLRLSDQFLIVRTEQRTLALRVDDVEGVITRDAADVAALSPELAKGLDLYPGAVRLDDDLVLIQDVERFLTPQQATEIDRALALVS